MANWNFKTIVTNKGVGFNIVNAAIDKSAMFTATTSNKMGTGGVNFVTSGVLNFYDTDMKLRETYARERGRIIVPPQAATEVLNDEGERIIHIVAAEASSYYCISPIGAGVVDGELYQLSPNESQTLTGVLGKRLFLAEDGLTVDGIAYEKHSVIHCETVDTVTVQGGTDPTIFVSFYKLNP